MMARNMVIGLDAGLVGRWARLILGTLVPVAATVRILLTGQLSSAFYGMTAIYLLLILGVYMAAHYLLGERLFAHTNPWVSTAILVGPPAIVLILGIGPDAFRLALGLYFSISLIFNFITSYGGCEVVTIPSLILGRKYVVYCPWNVIDVAERAITNRETRNS